MLLAPKRVFKKGKQSNGGNVLQQQSTHIRRLALHHHPKMKIEVNSDLIQTTVKASDGRVNSRAKALFK